MRWANLNKTNTQLQVQIRKAARESPKEKAEGHPIGKMFEWLVLNKAPSDDELTTERHGGRLYGVKSESKETQKNSNRSQDEPVMNSTVANQGLRVKIDLQRRLSSQECLERPFLKGMEAYLPR